MRRWMAGVVVAALAAGTGCAVQFTKRSPWDIQQLAELSDQLEQFKTLARLNAEEADELRRAKALLGERLSSSEASVGYDARGLVTRLVDQVLFDSGKATLRPTASRVLDKVAQVLNEVPDQPIGVEGHTDNVPIKYSKWADNAALSQARADAVAAYLVSTQGIGSNRVTAIGYGEARPVASNDTPEGRQRNRRVEIIILPRASGKSYEAEAARASRRSGYAK